MNTQTSIQSLAMRISFVMVGAALIAVFGTAGCAHTPGASSTDWGDRGDDTLIAGEWVLEGPDGSVLDSGVRFEDGVLTDWAGDSDFQWNYRVIALSEPLIALEVESRGDGGVWEFVIANGRLTRLGPPHTQTYRRPGAAPGLPEQGDDALIRGAWALDVKDVLAGPTSEGMTEETRALILGRIETYSNSVVFLDGDIEFVMTAPGKASRDLGTYQVTEAEGNRRVLAPVMDGQDDPMILTVDGDQLSLRERSHELTYHRQSAAQRTEALTRWESMFQPTAAEANGTIAALEGLWIRRLPAERMARMRAAAAESPAQMGELLAAIQAATPAVSFQSGVFTLGLVGPDEEPEIQVPFQLVSNRGGRMELEVDVPNAWGRQVAFVSGDALRLIVGGETLRFDRMTTP